VSDMSSGLNQERLRICEHAGTVYGRATTALNCLHKLSRQLANLSGLVKTSGAIFPASRGFFLHKIKRELFPATAKHQLRPGSAAEPLPCRPQFHVRISSSYVCSTRSAFDALPGREPRTIACHHCSSANRRTNHGRRSPASPQKVT